MRTALGFDSCFLFTVILLLRVEIFLFNVYLFRIQVCIQMHTIVKQF